MSSAENMMKWAIAVIVMFGLITSFFLLEWVVVLKIFLIFLAISLIGIVLLQSGKGGGLAAIGGLSDQSMMGTKTGTFLSKVTYMLGAAILISIIMLSKSNVSPRMVMQLPVNSDSSMQMPVSPDGSAAMTGGMTEVDSSAGMKEVSGALKPEAPVEEKAGTTE